MHRAAYHFLKALHIPSLTATKRKIHRTKGGGEVDNDNDSDNDDNDDNDDDDIDVSLEIEALANDVAAMLLTTVVDFEPGDVLGKLLGFVNQVRMSSEGVHDYLEHSCVVHKITPLQLRLWVRVRWGSMSHCLESTLAIQKVCLCQ
jgi:hypothetical protein